MTKHPRAADHDRGAVLLGEPRTDVDMDAPVFAAAGRNQDTVRR